MRYLALVADFDNTLATDSVVSDSTQEALARLRASGRRLVIATGRILEDLLDRWPAAAEADCIVAENGGIVYEPSARETIVLGEPVPEELLALLKERGVRRLEAGKTLIGTAAADAEKVVDAVRQLGLELQLVFNRQALMVVPTGVNKASGVKHALRRLGMSPHEAVAIGDAENDHSFLQIAECAVAVSNAVDSVKKRADIVTKAPAGAGVAELIDQIVTDDLEPLDVRLEHHHVALGERLDGTSAWVPPYGRNILVVGPSGSGKSTFVTGFLERLAERFYQVCVIDPEGDYATVQTMVTLGDSNRVPTVDEALAVLRDPDTHLNLDLLGVPLGDRPRYFGDLYPALQTMRSRTGRPHWIVVDEAHHVLPSTSGLSERVVPRRMGETVLVTVHPKELAREVLPLIDVVVAVGVEADRTLDEFALAAGRPPVRVDSSILGTGDVVCWFVHGGQDPFPMKVLRGQAERIRHRRKYAEGDLRHKSFFFKGPDGRLNLKAQNLALFCQLAEGVDADTWMFHLRRGDYSKWFGVSVKNPDLAAAVRQIERDPHAEPHATRAAVRQEIEARYTLPA